MDNRISIVLVLLILAGIIFTQRPAWLYEGVTGSETFIGGPVVGIILFSIFLIAIMAALQYFRNRMR